jgi:hypothetical protein
VKDLTIELLEDDEPSSLGMKGIRFLIFCNLVCSTFSVFFKSNSRNLLRPKYAAKWTGVKFRLFFKVVFLVLFVSSTIWIPASSPLTTR